MRISLFIEGEQKGELRSIDNANPSGCNCSEVQRCFLEPYAIERKDKWIQPTTISKLNLLINFADDFGEEKQK